MEAELRAARERAIVPLEARMTQFKEMLLERGVTPICEFLHKNVMSFVVFCVFVFFTVCRQKYVIFNICKFKLDCLMPALFILHVGVCILDLGQRAS